MKVLFLTLTSCNKISLDSALISSLTKLNGCNGHTEDCWKFGNLVNLLDRKGFIKICVIFAVIFKVFSLIWDSVI